MADAASKLRVALIGIVLVLLITNVVFLVMAHQAIGMMDAVYSVVIPGDQIGVADKLEKDLRAIPGVMLQRRDAEVYIDISTGKYWLAMETESEEFATKLERELLEIGLRVEKVLSSRRQYVVRMSQEFPTEAAAQAAMASARKQTQDLFKPKVTKGFTKTKTKGTQIDIQTMDKDALRAVQDVVDSKMLVLQAKQTNPPRKSE